MITLIFTQLAGGRTFDAKNPRQVAELAKRDLRLSVPTAFASSLDIDGRAVVIACVGSEGDTRAETAFGNWFAQTPEGSVNPALERNNVAAVISSAGIPADPASMFGSVLELHTPDAPHLDPDASFGNMIADALQDQLRQVTVLASQNLATVNNAHGDSILAVVSSTQEKAIEMTNEKINYSALLETIRSAAAKVQAMSGSKVEGFFADEQSLGKLINIASRTGALDAVSADAIRSDLTTFVDLLSLPSGSGLIQQAAAQSDSVSTAPVVEEPEIPVLEEVDEEENDNGVVYEEVVEELEGEDDSVEGEDDSITGFEYVDSFINAATSGEVMADASGQDLDEDDLTVITVAVRDALSQLGTKFSDLGTEFNEDDIEAADFEELASMLYTALAVVTESEDPADQESVSDVLGELDNAIEDVVTACLAQGDDGEEEDGVEFVEEEHEAIDDNNEPPEVEDGLDDGGADLELVSVEINPRMVIALTTDIDQSVYGTETVSALRAVESADGTVSYNLALGINGTGVRRTEPDGYFRTPLIETAKLLGKLPSGMIMLPRSVVENTESYQLVNAIASVVGGSFGSIFNEAVYGDSRIPLDVNGVLALGFEEEEAAGENAGASIDMTDLVSYAVSADPSVDDAGNQVIDLNVFITLRLIGVRHLSKKDRIVTRLCKLAQSMSANGVEVVPAFVYNATKAMYGSEVEREEISILQNAFEAVAAESDKWTAVGIISSDAVQGNLNSTGIISGGELVSMDSGIELEESEAYLASELMDIVNSSELGNVFELGGNIAVVLLQGAVEEAADEEEEE